MYKVVVSNQCGCFRTSGLKAHQEFESKDDALSTAIEMKDKMNSDFCSKHEFEVQEMFDNFMISFYDPRKNANCCGNGCCS